jgi:hypothetical protein
MPPGCESPTPTQPSQMAAAPPQQTPVAQDSSPAEPILEPIFHDDFEGETLKDGWQWINDPGDQRRVEMGHLVMPVLPGSSISGERALPRLQAPALIWKAPSDMTTFSFQVTLRFAPKQNFQGAGLIVLSERQMPMVSLTRAFCDRPVPCQGDAIQFENWLLWARADDYQPIIKGNNDLSPDGAVQLRMMIQPGVVTGFINVKDQWHPIGEWPLVAADRVGYVGLVTTTGGQDGEKSPAAFDDFFVLPVAKP